MNEIINEAWKKKHEAAKYAAKHQHRESYFWWDGYIAGAKKALGIADDKESDETFLDKVRNRNPMLYMILRKCTVSRKITSDSKDIIDICTNDENVFKMLSASPNKTVLAECAKLFCVDDLTVTCDLGEIRANADRQEN